MKHLINIATACAIAVLLAPLAGAQTLSVSGSAGTLTTAGATISGAVTATNLVNDVANSVSLRVFWGGADKETDATAWPVSAAVTGSYTNDMTYSYAITGMTPARTIYFQVRATDLAGSEWLSSSGSFTTSTATGSKPDYGFREMMRTGTVSISTANIATNTMGRSTVTNLTGVAITATTLTNTTAVITTGTIATLDSTALTATTGTLTTGNVGTLNATIHRINGTNYTPGIMIYTNGAGTEVIIPTLTGP